MRTTRRTTHSRIYWRLTACCLWATAAMAADGRLAPRAEVLKPAHTTLRAGIHRSDVVYVKFQDGLTVRLRDGVLTDLGTAGLRGAEKALAAFNGRWERVHSVDEASLDDLRSRAEHNLGRAIADLNLEYHYYLPAGADGLKTLDALNALDIVEIALPVPEPVAPPVPPNYQPNQGYLAAATGGIDASCIWQLPGGTGYNVRVADLEYSWNLSHQDLATVWLLGGTPTDPFADDNHGTAVLGELVALNNGSGVTGICYNSLAYVVAVNTNYVQNVAGAVTTAAGTLIAGDVMLIEQQIAGPNYTGVPPGSQVGLVPVEWYQPIYNAIVTAVGNGIIVVEAAGNGSQDLDNAVYSTGNGGHWPFLPGNDSGALIVGAGASPGGSDTDRSRLWYSNYGSTVDLQGWGENVYSTGYGDLYSAEGKNLWFTSSFAGTSSASPIVAGACALLESAHFAAQGTKLTPAQVKSYLQSTGSAQQSGTYPASQNIGPRPDVSAAITAAVPAMDANANGTPDLCDQLAGLEACCHAAGGCTDTTSSNCNANGGTPQGTGTSCATASCPAPEACCLPAGGCSDVTVAACTQAGGLSQGPGTNCATTTCAPAMEACCFDSPPGNCVDMQPVQCGMAGGVLQGAGSTCGTVQCLAMYPKFSQPPTTDHDNIPSNIDLLSLVPNIVEADDFQSDGRPITRVRWWGSYMDARYLPVAFGGMPSPYEIDGWLISFHEPLSAKPPMPPQPPLGLYFANAADVAIMPTSIPSCDGHAVFQYTVDITRCCLLQSLPDSRSGWIPAQPDAFEEEHCFVYDLDIQAVVGASWTRQNPFGACVSAPTQNMGPGFDFWGWHSTGVEMGRRNALTTAVTFGAGGVFQYGPWADTQPICSQPPVNMAFELLTTDPIVPPPCLEACCMPDGSCADMLPAACGASGGTPYGAGSSCASTVCPTPTDACCLPDGSCATISVASCRAQGGFFTPGGVCAGDLDGNLVDDACEAGPDEYLFEFSLDIGSDSELSDPLRDGDEAFDPGDVYWWQSAPVVPPGRDGFKDDAFVFGADPWPDAPDAAGVTAVPVGNGVVSYSTYFDLDGHDQLDVNLHAAEWVPPDSPLAAPIGQFASACIYTPEHLLISYDDDNSVGWPNGDVPVTAPSPAGVFSYGSTLGNDEIIGIQLLVPPGPPPYPLLSVYPVAREDKVHQSLAPNPDASPNDDDDVDSLDLVAQKHECEFWYFSADHEATNGLDPGDIYQVTPSGPVMVIDDVIHLGIPDDTDIDAFEFVWLADPINPLTPSLGMIFSVDDDDPLTPVDESGGMIPMQIYGSVLTGYSFPVSDPLFDDIDALTAWSGSLRSCPGDCDLDRLIGGGDVPGFVACVAGPSGGLGGLGCLCADFDYDGDADLVDFAAFQRGYGSACP